MKKIILFTTLLILNQAVFAENTPQNSNPNRHTSKQQQLKDIQWLRHPQVRITQDDLENQNRYINLRLSVDGSGKITNISILTSTQLPALERKVIRATQKALFKATGYPFVVDQDFKLDLASDDNSQESSEEDL